MNGYDWRFDKLRQEKSIIFFISNGCEDMMLAADLARIWLKEMKLEKSDLTLHNSDRRMSMAKSSVEELLIAGGANEAIRMKYDSLKTKEDFVAKAAEDGYEFTLVEFDAVLNESGDSFDLIGNPGKRQIWWK